MRLSGALEASRRKMLGWRDEVLDATDLARSLTEWIAADGVKQATLAHFAPAAVTESLKRLDPTAPELAAPAKTAEELRAQLTAIVDRRVEVVIAERKEDGPAFNQFLRGLVLSRLDQMWLDHVMSEEDRQREVYLSSFADGDPVVKHEISSLTIFNQAMERTEADIRAAFASVVKNRDQSLRYG
jgi:preprotein translocase subunit SecA